MFFESNVYLNQIKHILIHPTIRWLVSMVEGKKEKRMAVSMAVVKSIKGETAKKILSSAARPSNTNDLRKKCSEILKKS